MNRVRFLSLSTIQAVDIIGEQTVQVTVGSANTELIYSFAAAIMRTDLICRLPLSLSTYEFHMQTGEVIVEQHTKCSRHTAPLFQMLLLFL